MQYEIEYTWKENKGIVCIGIHNLKNQVELTGKSGANLLSKFYINKTFNYIAKHDNFFDVNDIRLSEVCTSHKPSASNTRSDIANILKLSLRRQLKYVITT